MLARTSDHSSLPNSIASAIQLSRIEVRADNNIEVALVEHLSTSRSTREFAGTHDCLDIPSKNDTFKFKVIIGL